MHPFHGEDGSDDEAHLTPRASKPSSRLAEHDPDQEPRSGWRSQGRALAGFLLSDQILKQLLGQCLMGQSRIDLGGLSAIGGGDGQNLAVDDKGSGIGSSIDLDVYRTARHAKALHTAAEKLSGSFHTHWPDHATAAGVLCRGKVGHMAIRNDAEGRTTSGLNV